LFAFRPTCALVCIYKSSKQTSNLADVCSKRVTLLRNVDRANRKSVLGLPILDRWRRKRSGATTDRCQSARRASFAPPPPPPRGAADRM